MEVSSVFDLVTETLREQLLNRRSKITSKDWDQDAWWEIPIIKTVHVMTDWGHDTLYQERSNVIETITKHRQIWLVESETAGNDVPLSREAVVDDAEDEEDELYADAEGVTVHARRRWWIEKGIIPFLNASGR
jgi:hypothetical protein